MCQWSLQFTLTDVHVLAGESLVKSEFSMLKALLSSHSKFTVSSLRLSHIILFTVAPQFSQSFQSNQGAVIHCFSIVNYFGSVSPAR